MVLGRPDVWPADMALARPSRVKGSVIGPTREMTELVRHATVASVAARLFCTTTSPVGAA